MSSYSRILFIVPSEKIGLVAQLVAGEVGEFTVTPVLKEQRSRSDTGRLSQTKKSPVQGPASLTRVGKLILSQLPLWDTGQPGLTSADLGNVLMESGFQPQSASGCLSDLFQERVVHREGTMKTYHYWRLS